MLPLTFSMTGIGQSFQITASNLPSGGSNKVEELKSVIRAHLDTNGTPSSI